MKIKFFIISLLTVFMLSSCENQDYINEEIQQQNNPFLKSTDEEDKIIVNLRATKRTPCIGEKEYSELDKGRSGDIEIVLNKPAIEDMIIDLSYFVQKRATTQKKAVPYLRFGNEIWIQKGQTRGYLQACDAEHAVTMLFPTNKTETVYVSFIFEVNRINNVNVNDCKDKYTINQHGNKFEIWNTFLGGGWLIPPHKPFE